MAKRASWLTDLPLDLRQADAFGVVGLVDRLADLIEDGDPPFTISLSGSWGVGKSTVTEELRTRLREKGIAGVVVDAWTEDVEHLRRTLAVQVGAKLSDKPDDLASQAAKLDEGIRTTENRPLAPKLNLVSGNPFKGIRKISGPSAVLLGIDLLLFVLTICSAIWFPAATSILAALLSAILIFTLFQSGLLLHIVTTSQSVAPASESIQMAESFKNAVTGGVLKGHNKVLVVVDNLDRLSGDDALKALAQIRALVEIPESRAVFLIPIDREALERHIRPRIDPNASDNPDESPHDVSEGEGAAADYLEKFFNLDLHLTRPDVLDLRRWALQEARTILPSDDEDDLATAVQVVCSAAGGSPRSVKRILNGIGARQRLLDPSAHPAMSLAQLAFVESLAIQFPELISWLTPDGRRFVALREGAKQGPETVEVTGMSKARKGRLCEFLLVNSEIPITAPMTRLAMSLREDTVWKGVSSPTELQEALGAGRPDAFNSALAALDESETELAVDAAISSIERSVPEFARDAVSGLVAIGEAVVNYPNAAKKLHPLAVRAFLRSDHINRRRVTRALGALLFDERYDHSELSELAASFIETLTSSSPVSEVSQGLVWAVRLSGSRASGQQRSAACDAFGKLDDDSLAPLFESLTDADLWAVEGRVADMYVDRLSTWEAPSPDYSSLATAVARLSLLVEHGWSKPEGLQQIASTAAGRLRALPDDRESFDFVSQLASLLRAATPGSEIDQLATSLVTVPGTVDVPARFASALRLPVQDAVKPVIDHTLTDWLRVATLPPATSLISDHGAALRDFGFDPVPVLTKRWAAAEGREWALLAVDFDGGEHAEIIPQALAGASDNNYASLVEEAADIAASRRDMQLGHLLVDNLATRSSRLPAARLVDLAGALDRLQQAGVDYSALVDAIEARIGTEPTIGDLAHSVRQMHERGLRALRVLAAPLAARGSAAGGILREDVPWLVRHTGGSTEARRVAIRVIDSDAAPDVCSMAEDIRSSLKKHAEVGLALVRRAAGAPTGDEARMFLNNALRWRKPAGREYQEYSRLLTTTAQQWSETTDLVNRLWGP